MPMATEAGIPVFFSFFCAAFTSEEMKSSVFFDASAVVAPAILWPILAQWLAHRSAHSDSNDVIQSFVDGIIVGLWVTLTHFNLLASAVMA